MATLTDQIDRFVRWFFNSSPDQVSIEPPRRIAESSRMKSRASARSRSAATSRPPIERRASGRRSERVQA